MVRALERILVILLTATIALAPLGAALAAPPDRLVVFGDSLSDPGNAYLLLHKVDVPPFASLVPDAPYARGALHFSNGPTWIEQLSLIDHAFPSAGPALLVPTIFTNYAVGGARAGGTRPFDLGAQVALFLQEHGPTVKGDALYAMWIGGDDLRDALAALATDPTGATSGGILQTALTNVGGNLMALYDAGARRFLIPNAPDIGKVPAVRPLGPAVQAAARQLVTQYNAALAAYVQNFASLPGVHVTSVDVFSLFDAVVAAPGTYGLTDSTHACIVPGTTVHPYCSHPNEYLFWDGLHPTVAGHRIVALQAAAALGIATHR
jgi:phospholipase/lecithinase/hemolysin